MKRQQPTGPGSLWGSTLRRRTGLKSNKRPRGRSKRMAKLYGARWGRWAFVAWLLAEYPRCVIVWDGRCRGRATTVDELIHRSNERHLVPDSKAVRAGARFFPACLPCHMAKEGHLIEAQRRGLYRPRRKGENDGEHDRVGAREHLAAFDAAALRALWTRGARDNPLWD